MNPARTLLESRLVLLAQTGDRDALNRLLRSVQGHLHAYLSRLTRPDLADDLLQETLLRVYRKLRWLREPQLFRPWCFRIASRIAFRTLRRERRRRPASCDVADLPASPPVSAFAPEDATRVRELLADLPTASGAVLVLHYLDQRTLADVAEALGIPLGTAKSRLAYGLERLRRRGLRPSARPDHV